MPELSEVFEQLISQSCDDGGWGYAVGDAPQVEPTALALLALSASGDRYRDEINRARKVLDQFVDVDNSFPVQGGRVEARWPTALVLWTQAVLEYPRESIERTARRLLGLAGRIPEDPRAAEMHDIDFKLQGWAWAENNFSWAEPTAWACLALQRAGFGSHPRVAEGLKLLLDRAQDTGGINYGNRRVFGKLTEPIPGTTALMLLALQKHPIHPRIEAAVRFQLSDANKCADLEHLCWSRLALDMYCDAAVLAQVDSNIDAAYRARRESNWTQPRPICEALTAMALSCKTSNLFRIPEFSCEHTLAALTPKPKTKKLGERVKSYVRGLAIEAAGSLRPLAPKSDVHIAAAADYSANLAGIVRCQYEHFRTSAPLSGKRVLLKPNLVEYHREKVINTHPNVVAAAIELCKSEGAAEVVVAEGPGHWRNAEYLVQASGLGDVLRHYQVKFIDLNHDEPHKCLNMGRLTRLEYLHLAESVVRADVVISLPKLKTHHWVGATLSLKNLFGTLPGTCYGWPKNELHWRGIENSIVDIALTRTPQLAIVDAIVGMEGDGPLNGEPRPLGAIVMGTDLLAVDATCCRLMQLDPAKIDYLRLGNAKKLGQLKVEAIQQLGESIASLAQPFATLPQFHKLFLNRSA